MPSKDEHRGHEMPTSFDRKSRVEWLSDPVKYKVLSKVFSIDGKINFYLRRYCQQKLSCATEVFRCIAHLMRIAN